MVMVVMVMMIGQEGLRHDDASSAASVAEQRA